MEVKPPVAIALIVVAVLIVGVIAFKVLGPGAGLSTEKPPPIVSGLSGGAGPQSKSLGVQNPNAGPAPMTPPGGGSK